MKNIETVTQSLLKELFCYNEKTGILTRRVTRGKELAGSVAGTICRQGYRCVHLNYSVYRVHNLIWIYVYGKPPKNIIDHINGDKSDNRIKNLRDATYRENRINSRKRDDTVSGITGISYYKDTKKWGAWIKTKKKRVHLGMFNHLEDAVVARLAGEQEVYL